jgi:hypothetical protein
MIANWNLRTNNHSGKTPCDYIIILVKKHQQSKKRIRGNNSYKLLWGAVVLWSYKLTVGSASGWCALSMRQKLGIIISDRPCRSLHVGDMSEQPSGPQTAGIDGHRAESYMPGLAGGRAPQDQDPRTGRTLLHLSLDLLASPKLEEDVASPQTKLANAPLAPPCPAAIAAAAGACVSLVADVEEGRDVGGEGQVVEREELPGLAAGAREEVELDEVLVGGIEVEAADMVPSLVSRERRDGAAAREAEEGWVCRGAGQDRIHESGIFSPKTFHMRRLLRTLSLRFARLPWRLICYRSRSATDSCPTRRSSPSSTLRLPRARVAWKFRKEAEQVSKETGHLNGEEEDCQGHGGSEIPASADEAFVESDTTVDSGHPRNSAGNGRRTALHGAGAAPALLAWLQSTF